MNQPTDRKKPVSKVKPQTAPSVPPAAKTNTALLAPKTVELTAATSELPPPTKIEEMQDIGTRMCGIPPSELSPEKLLDGLSEDTDTSH